jgi:hypothetical protein
MDTREKGGQKGPTKSPLHPSSPQAASHSAFMRIFFQMATLVFLAAAAPANFIAAQIVLFLLGWFVIEKTFQYFHFSTQHLQFFFHTG